MSLPTCGPRFLSWPLAPLKIALSIIVLQALSMADCSILVRLFALLNVTSSLQTQFLIFTVRRETPQQPTRRLAALSLLDT